MKAARYLALLIILLIFFACKGKPESCETSVQSDQVSAQTISPEAVETQETKTEPQAAATKANPKPEVKATPVAEPEPVKPKSDQAFPHF